MRTRFALPLVTALALVGAAGLAGCGGSASGSSPVGTWGDESGPHLVLSDDGGLSGSDGCNRLSGEWTQSGDRVAFRGVVTTLMACPDVDTWLSGLDSAEVAGDELRISDAAGTEIGVLARN